MHTEVSCWQLHDQVYKLVANLLPAVDDQCDLFIQRIAHGKPLALQDINQCFAQQIVNTE